MSRLRDDLATDAPHAVPGVIVLPPEHGDDETRWLQAWPETGSVLAIRELGLDDAATWRAVVAKAYERYPNHWAAAVSFHF